MKMNMKMDFGIKSIGKQIRNITTLYKIIIIVGLNVAISALSFMFLISPQFAEKRKLAGEYQSVRADLNKMIDIRDNMPRYRQEYAKVQETLEETLRQLPETKDIPNLLRSVSAMGTESKVKITYFEPGKIQPKEFYGEFPFKLKYHAPFHNIGYFFDGMRKIERIVDISDFTLTAKGPPNKIVLEGECTAKSYVYLRKQPAAAPKKEERKDAKNVQDNKK
jgi:type IV pilus assembly protein PilO